MGGWCGPPPPIKPTPPTLNAMFEVGGFVIGTVQRRM